ncbi:MAG TPA: glycosyltransferase [Lachnospiraceae bacterium]|nr:glycosyltransferase [Lachnospiraceae bacterium]
MNVVMLRTHACRPDPRVEKEINTLLGVDNLSVKVVCWDRDQKYNSREEKLKVPNGAVPIIRFGIPASWGGGMKSNLAATIKFEWKLFWWLIRNHKLYDVVHACDLLTGLPAFLPCKIFRKKMVYDIFDYYAATQQTSSRIRKFLSSMEDFIINSAAVTIICSEKRTEQIQNAHPKKLVILHNAPSQEQIQQAFVKDFPLAEETKRVKIVYVGNLVEDRFITKALACAENMPEIEFHIGGFGVLEDKVKELSGLHDNIYFYGKMAYQDVLALETKCDIMMALYDPAVPNHAYAAPNKFYEALALGKPLVMFCNTGMDNVIRDNHIGAVCTPTKEGLESAFRTLIDKKNEWPVISEKMKKLFKENYSWNIMDKRLKSIYMNLLG